MVFITDHAPTEFMENKAITAVALVLTLLLAGCLNVDPDVECPMWCFLMIGPASPHEPWRALNSSLTTTATTSKPPSSVH